VAYWDNIFAKKILKQKLLIVCRDLNFSLKRSKIWDAIANIDVLSKYFVRKLDDLCLYDVELVKINHTCRNMHTRDGRIAK
jgi:hypothetical protein